MRVLLGFIMGMVLGGAGFHLAGAQGEIADFAVIIEPSDNGAELSCVRGCTWLELSFSCDGALNCRAQIDEYGVGGVDPPPEEP